VEVVRVQIVDSDKSPYAVKEVEVEGKFVAATITEDLVIIFGHNICEKCEANQR
jgi:hypothetical protein